MATMAAGAAARLKAGHIDSGGIQGSAGLRLVAGARGTIPAEMQRPESDSVPRIRIPGGTG